MAKYLGEIATLVFDLARDDLEWTIELEAIKFH
jgi:hypothetical protein